MLEWNRAESVGTCAITAKKIKHELPAVYQDLLPDILERSIVDEAFATCRNCAMVCPAGKEADKLGRPSYLPDRKCCTYFPVLPNYLVGGILSSTDQAAAEGKGRIEAAITAGVGITPFGIFPPRTYSLLFKQGVGFGRSKALLCPYFNLKEENCTIWRHRDAVCSTYFCKTVAGSAGKAFWEALKKYLLYIQDCLSGYVLLEMGFDAGMIMRKFSAAEPQSLTAEELDRQAPDPVTYRAMWGEWTGKETAFYLEAYERVRDLSADHFTSLTGIQERILRKELDARWQQMMMLPDKLQADASQLTESPKQGMVEVQLAEADISIGVPAAIFAYFDGVRTNGDVLELIHRNEKINISEDLLLPLYHYGILN